MYVKVVRIYWRDRHGGDHGRVLQRQFDGILRDHFRLGGRSVRCCLLPYSHNEAPLAQVSEHSTRSEKSHSNDFRFGTYQLLDLNDSTI